MDDVQKADPNARRTALVVLTVGTLLGAALLTTSSEFQDEFEEWFKQDPETRLHVVAAAMAVLTAGPAIGMAWYLWRLGRRIIRAGRYPPPGFRVIRDTLVVTGESASRQARLMQVIAAAIGVGGVLLSFFMWRLLVLLARGAARAGG